MLTIYLLFFFANLLVGLFHRKSNLLILATSIFIIMVFVGSRNVVDLDGYMDDYNIGANNYFSGGQVIFYHFMLVCKFFGMDFDTYRLVLSVVGLSCYYYFVNKFSPLPNLVYAAYMGYLLIMDDVQIRNFVGCAVFSVGLVILLSYQKGWRWKYLIAIVLAALNHSSFWVYLVFLLLPKSNLKESRFIKVFSMSFLAFSIFILFIRGYLNSFIMMFSFIDEEKALGYSENATRFGGAVYMALHLFATTCVWWMFEKTKSHNSRCVRMYGNGQIQKVLQITLLLDLLAISLFPAVVFSITFYRLIRNLYLLNAVAFSVGFVKTRSKLFPLVALIIYTAVFFYFDLTSFERVNVILRPLFMDNIYFE